MKKKDLLYLNTGNFNEKFKNYLLQQFNQKNFKYQVNQKPITKSKIFH